MQQSCQKKSWTIIDFCFVQTQQKQFLALLHPTKYSAIRYFSYYFYHSAYIYVDMYMLINNFVWIPIQNEMFWLPFVCKFFGAPNIKTTADAVAVEVELGASMLLGWTKKEHQVYMNRNSFSNVICFVSLQLCI